jgi:hypothetical protein
MIRYTGQIIILSVRYIGLIARYASLRKNERGETDMRGYFTFNGFVGLVDGIYRLFASESDYYEAVEPCED